MSKLTDKACIHTINPFGFNQNEGKTEKTESRRKFAFILPRCIRCSLEQQKPRLFKPKNNSALVIEHQAMRSRFFSKAMFFLSEKESLKGLTALVVRLSGCLHTSRIATNDVKTLARVSLSERGF